ncbi:MAG: hypothetical protein JXA33_10900 [Anaerolineae bacterium]|nr:hypothetical protein [Anaerolineae bacterium]
MADRIGEWLEGIPLWGIVLGLLAFFIVFYFTLAYFDVRMDSFTLPFGLNKVFTPLGITLLTAAAVTGGLGFGVVKERIGL